MTARNLRALPKVYIWTGQDGQDRMDLGKDCIGLSFSKGFGPHGNFEISLLPRTSDGTQTLADLRRMAKIYQSVRPNAPVSLGFEEDGGITFGLVDRIERVRFWGAPVRYGVRITGRDIGKALTDNVIKATTAVQEWTKFRDKVSAALGETHPLIYDLEGTWGPRDEDGVPRFTGMTVEDVLSWFVSNAATMTIPILASVTGGTGRIGDFITISSTGDIDGVLGGDEVTTWNDSRIWSEGLHTYQGSIYGFLMGSVLDQDFYECWVDCIPTGTAIPQMVLMVRPKPFDEPALEFEPVTEETGLTWADLVTMVDQKPDHEIPLDDVISENLGISDADAFAVYKVVGKHSLCGNEQQDAEGLSYPLVCTWNAKRHGVKAYNTQMALVGANLARKAAGEEDYTVEVDKDIRQFRGRLFNWYRLNARFETGTLQVVGRDRYRVGDPVKLRWAIPPIGNEQAMRYYTVGVTWSWQFGSDYTTTLQLTRGHNDGMLTELRAEIEADAPTSNPSHYAAT